MSVRDLLDDDPDWSEDDFNMTFYEYEEAAMNHAIYDNHLVYPVLGLVSEAGEVADKVKKPCVTRRLKSPIRSLT